MNGTEIPSREVTRGRLESELSNVAVAVEMVATGAATRVTVGGLRFGDQLAARFHDEAARRGVSVAPLYWPDDAGCDVVVERAPLEEAHA